MLDDAFATKMVRAGSAASHRFAFDMMQTALQCQRAHPSGGISAGNGGGGAAAGGTTTGAAATEAVLDEVAGIACPLLSRARISSALIVPCAAAISSRTFTNSFCVFQTLRNAGTSSSWTAVFIRA